MVQKVFSLQWFQNGTISNNSIYFNVSYPNRTSDVLTVSFQSPANNLGTQEILTGTSLYLDGEAASLLLSWTTISNKANLNGGLQVSFDLGETWTTFSPTAGNKANKSTWILLPASAIGSLGVAGILNPYDSATISLRVVVPPSFSNYGVLNFNIGVDFDVI
jgi:hypothetical protein